MTKTTELTDLELTLLSSASGRQDGNIHPLPKSAGSDGELLDAALCKLLERELVEEMIVIHLRQCWHQREGERIGLIVTAAGRAAINNDGDGSEAGCGGGKAGDTAEAVLGAGNATAPQPADDEPALKQPSGKTALVLELLSREVGASVDELVAATGWLPHSTRAALTGLRKKGHAIGKTKADGVTRYRIAAAATQ